MPGSGATSNLPLILESRRLGCEVVDVTPVPMEDQLTVLERGSAFSSCQVMAAFGI